MPLLADGKITNKSASTSVTQVVSRTVSRLGEQIVILVNNRCVTTKNEKLTIGEYMCALIGRRENNK